ncbi:N-acetylmuramoyl-L-alanine amidase [Salirhabdus salicampi]|uniref:N-acetylmuramoyl-L-alanine amidase n=1 Tax=Salirhabdus salicampi TaxID=476102 RepID=UPI0020C2D552|nr:N-acetylmuramoyl-L-alanine amidase [Salirhabdus salicampi]MCP8615282.1 N-acetylmuramoyl-L-alanine amidase [Salirhabdus salicampi]
MKTRWTILAFILFALTSCSGKDKNMMPNELEFTPHSQKLTELEMLVPESTGDGMELLRFYQGREVQKQSNPDIPDRGQVLEVDAEDSKEHDSTKRYSETNIKVKNMLLPEENSEQREEDISHVVIHFISNVANNPNNPYDINDVYSIFSTYGLSVHYLIDRQGVIYRLVPEERKAYHAGSSGQLPQFPQLDGNLNEHSIGIELMAIGTKEEMTSMISEELYERIDPRLIGYTEEQYGSLKALIQDIVSRYPKVKNNRDHIVGHDEYAPHRKNDPGSLFEWSKIGF